MRRLIGWIRQKPTRLIGKLVATDENAVACWFWAWLITTAGLAYAERDRLITELHQLRLRQASNCAIFRFEAGRIFQKIPC